MGDIVFRTKISVISVTPILLLFLSNVIVYFEYWTGERFFSGKDLLTAFGPLLNFQTDCLQQHSLPLWNPFMNFGYPFVEHYSNTMLFPTHLLMGLLTGSSLLLIQREILLWIFIGGIGAYLCVREFGNSRTAGIVAGMSYMFCGQVMALPHWHLLVYNAACFPFLIFGYHQSVRSGKPFSIISILFLAFQIVGGHITTAVLGVYIFAAYVVVDSVIRRNSMFGIRYLFLSCLFAILLSLPKLANLAAAMSSGPRMLAPESLHTKDPFNTINFYNFMSYLLPVKYFFSLYIGLIGILAFVFSLIRRKLSFNALLLLFIVTSWLLMVDSKGNVSLLRSAANILPVMKLVRNEWFEWFYPSLFAILWLAPLVDQFLKVSPGRDHLIAGAFVMAALSLVFLTGFNTDVYLTAFVLQLLFILLFMSTGFLKDREHIQFIAVILLVTLEFAAVLHRVGVDELPLRDQQRIRLAVVDQGSVERSYRENNRVQNKFYADSLQDHLRPSISESIGWPVLQSGLGGDPSYNLYPEQFARFIDDINLKRFSGWWYNAQERHDFIRLKDSGMLTLMDGQPLFSVFSQTTGKPSGNVSFDAISCSSFDFSVNAPELGFFLLNQMYDDRWKVLVDGKEQPLKRANEYFMGVEIAPGAHNVAFRFRDTTFMLSLAISGMTVIALISAGLFGIRRRMKS